MSPGTGVNLDRYMIWTKHEPFSLLRQSHVTGEQIFSLGKWRDTKVVCDYMFGHNDWVDEISEADAWRRFPNAFLNLVPKLKVNSRDLVID
jgi:hypothetical protein